MKKAHEIKTLKHIAGSGTTRPILGSMLVLLRTKRLIKVVTGNGANYSLIYGVTVLLVIAALRVLRVHVA